MVSREDLAPQEQATGSLAPPPQRSKALALLQPFPQARPRPRTQGSEVCLDRDNELWLYFLPGGERNALDKVQVSLFCSSTESQREREQGGRVLTPLLESCVPKAL